MEAKNMELEQIIKKAEEHIPGAGGKVESSNFSYDTQITHISTTDLICTETTNYKVIVNAVKYDVHDTDDMTMRMSRYMTILCQKKGESEIKEKSTGNMVWLDEFHWNENIKDRVYKTELRPFDKIKVNCLENDVIEASWVDYKGNIAVDEGKEMTYRIDLNEVVYKA